MAYQGRELERRLAKPEVEKALPEDAIREDDEVPRWIECGELLKHTVDGTSGVRSCKNDEPTTRSQPAVGGAQGLERTVEMLERSTEHNEVAPLTTCGQLELNSLGGALRSGNFGNFDSESPPVTARKQLEQLPEPAADIQHRPILEARARLDALKLRGPHCGSSALLRIAT